MAKLSNGYTSTNVFILLSLAVCVLLGSSAPSSRNESSFCQSPDREDLDLGRTDIVSYTSPLSLVLLVHILYAL